MKFEHMKNIYILLSVSLLIASCGPTTVVQSDNYQPAPAPAPVEEVSYQSFYDQLSPYGTWVNYPGYGYVWMPNAGPDFRPYSTNGNWIYTDAGWTWASNYNWGWAPFHYGRWFFENGYGWIWVPGNEWAPAWVSWRGGGDYYGWAPLGPRVSVDMALHNYNPPAYYWNFVPRQYIGNPGWHNYYVNQNRNVTIINNTTIINNYSGTNRARYAYAPGPDPVEVRRVSGNNFTPVQLRETSSPGERISGNQYMIYQPRVSSTTTSRGNTPGRPSVVAPARYESFNNVRPSNQYRINENTGNNQPNNNPQPAYNPRPATQNPVSNLPVNNPQPANNPRPAMQNPVNNQQANNPQPANNPRPATQNPVNNQPANNPRPATQASVNNQPANNPVPQNRNTTASPGTAARPASRDLNKARADRYIQQQTQFNTRPVPPRAATENPVQTTGRASAVRNPNNGHPVQRTATPDNKPVPNKPDQKPVEQPKTRSANDD